MSMIGTPTDSMTLPSMRMDVASAA